MFFKVGVLKIFEIFTGKYLCWSLFLNKVAGLRLQHRSLTANFAKFLSKTAFFIEQLRWLLLKVGNSILHLYVMYCSQSLLE